MRHLLLIVLSLLTVLRLPRAEPLERAPYRNSKLPIEDRVRDMLGRMTREEKFVRAGTERAADAGKVDALDRRVWRVSCDDRRSSKDIRLRGELTVR
jgi:hypothetical protein